ncbi:histone deacetylase family protein [Sphingosinicella sp. CPCC 101087]|uniref:histone deacetylase family protein n=1 Tax=Sphingosinicella sp. CPCC 101087 TaxID=2497754 RepID=UPI00101CABE8|nr:histone deacetylase family protein [Sphingosinicella sp. CPCC 101087]
MRRFFDPRQLAHAPVQELHNGGFAPYAEHPGRAESMLAAIGPVEPAVDHGEAPLRAVHTADYLDFLRAAWRDWRAAGRPGDAGGYAWPVVRRRPLALDRIDARLGLYSFDASSPIAEGTWEAAYWSAQTALTALDGVLAGGTGAFALCRPPGHHCGADYLGGYCYLNNAAIAAQSAVAAGRRPAILDIDYHHGNGTQDIFYDRGDVLFVSIHADPVTDYPFFWGHADETGHGPGAGATINLPLPRGAGAAEYLPALDRALAEIRAWSPDVLLCSFGADTFSGDPISHFELETADFSALSSRIAALGAPVLVVMEGGYAVDALGHNVAAFLSGF